MTRLYLDAMPVEWWQQDPIRWDLRITNDPTERRINKRLRQFDELLYQDAVSVRRLWCENEDGSKVIIDPTSDDGTWDLKFLFESVSATEEIDLSNSTIKANTSCEGMFDHLSAKTLVLPKEFDTRTVTDMSKMFRNLKLSEGGLDIRCLTTSRVETFAEFMSLAQAGRFWQCLDTSSATNLNSMFNHASLYTHYDLLPGNILDWSERITTVLDISNLDLSNAKDLSNFFGSDSVGGSSVIPYAIMMAGVDSLKEMYISDSLFAACGMSYIFVNPDHTNWNALIDQDKAASEKWSAYHWFEGDYVLTGNSDDISMKYAYVSNEIDGNRGRFSIYEPIIRDLYLYEEGGPDGCPVAVITNDQIGYKWPIQSYDGLHKSIYDNTWHNVNIGSDTDIIFRNGDGSIVTGILNAADFNKMFTGVTNKGWMRNFYLENLNISYFESLNDMLNFKEGFTNITGDVVLSGVFADYAKSAERTFKGLSADKIRIEGLYLPNVRSLKGMFEDCKVEVIDISKMMFNRIEDVSEMFKGCLAKKITGINMKTDNIMDFRSMFEGCKNIRTLHLESFNTMIGMPLQDSWGPVPDTSRMFYGCEKLALIYVDPDNSDWFASYSVPNDSEMFVGCAVLKELFVDSKLNYNEPNHMMYCHEYSVERGDFYFDFNTPGEPTYGVFIAKRDSSLIPESLLLIRYKDNDGWKKVYSRCREDNGWVKTMPIKR